MSPYLAAATVALLYGVAGFGVLSLLGRDTQPHSASDLASAGGLAYVVGLAASSIVLIALVCAGMALSPGLIIAVCLLIGLAGLPAAVKRRSVSASDSSRRHHIRRRSPREGRFAGVIIGLVVAYVYLGARWATVLPLANSWDAWAMWLRKGYLLYFYGHLPTAFLSSPTFAQGHPNYPLLIPVMNALWFHLAGTGAVAIHLQYWALFVAALWAAGFMASRHARPAAWLPLIAALAVIPALRAQLMTLYADVPMGLLMLIGLLHLGEWVTADETQSFAPLGVGALLLAAAANTKDEGMTGGLAILAALWIVCLGFRGLRSRRRLLGLTAATCAFGACVAPWQIWLAVHHIGGDVPIGQGLSPAYVVSRLGRFSPSLHAFLSNSVAADWYFVVPLAGSVLLVCLLAGEATPLAAFLVLAGLLNAVSILWVYVISANPLQWYLNTSANRTVDGLVFISVATLILLSGRLLPGGRDLPLPLYPARERHANLVRPATSRWQRR